MFKFKITDNLIKIVFIVVFLILTYSVYNLFLALNNFKETVYKESLKKSVIVLDSVGNQEYVKLSTAREDVISSLSLEYVKRMLTYDYINYKSNLSWLKTYSSKTTYQKWLKMFEDYGKNLKFTKSSYKAIIKNAAYSIDKNNYIAYYEVQHKLLSKTKKKSLTYIVQLTFNFSEPTNVNKLGLYAVDLEITNIKDFDMEEYKNIFGGK